jgi:hypothetical protein
LGEALNGHRSKIAELESQLEESWGTETLDKNRISELEALVAKGSASAADKAIFDAKERSHKTTAEKLQAMIDRKMHEIEALQAKVTRLECESGANATVQAGALEETIKQVGPVSFSQLSSLPCSLRPLLSPSPIVVIPPSYRLNVHTRDSL